MGETWSLLSHSGQEVEMTMNDDDYSYCDVTERLFSEFERAHPLPVIAAVVRQCRADLDGSPREAVPELVERLARQRLLGQQPNTTPTGSIVPV